MDGGHSFGPGREKLSFSPSSACGGIRPAPVIARHDFPQAWKIILALPEVAAGAHGSREADIFRQYCPLPEAEVHELCYQILVRLMPAVVEESLDDFGAAVNRLQDIGFKRVECSRECAAIVHCLSRSLLLRRGGKAGDFARGGCRYPGLHSRGSCGSTIWQGSREYRIQGKREASVTIPRGPGRVRDPFPLIGTRGPCAI